jgi:hypothetical protein
MNDKERQPARIDTQAIAYATGVLTVEEFVYLKEIGDRADAERADEAAAAASRHTAVASSMQRLAQAKSDIVAIQRAKAELANPILGSGTQVN